MVTTLYGIEDKITSTRRDGNSTRIVDNAIQLLFKGHTIKAEDHWDRHPAHRLLFFRILQRLEVEHHLYPNLHLKVDNQRLTIELI